MQIYEVFGLGAVKNALDFGPGANTRAAQRQQGEYAASAAKSAEKLRQQGYGQLPTAASVSQLVTQVQNDRAAQQLVQTWAAQWPKIAATVPVLKPKSPASQPAAATPTAAFGGQSLDPNDPTTARIISQLRAQGKLTEQQTTRPDPDEYRKAFETWADDVVERTTRMSGVMDQIKKQSDWAQRFAEAANRVVSTADNAQQNSQAVKQYFTLAIAAARAVNQRQPVTRAGTGAGLNDSQAAALAQAIGVDASDVARMNAYMRQKGEKITVDSTGSPSLDALLRSAKLLR